MQLNRILKFKASPNRFSGDEKPVGGVVDHRLWYRLSTTFQMVDVEVLTFRSMLDVGKIAISDFG